MAPLQAAAPDQPYGLQAQLHGQPLQILPGLNADAQDVAPGAQSQLQIESSKGQHSFSDASGLKQIFAASRHIGQHTKAGVRRLRLIRLEEN